MKPVQQTVEPIQRVSRIYEKVFSPAGDGFSGFTVYYGGDLFTNHIVFFDRDNHDEVAGKVSAAHADYCKACLEASNEVL